MYSVESFIFEATEEGYWIDPNYGDGFRRLRLSKEDVVEVIADMQQWLETQND